MRFRDIEKVILKDGWYIIDISGSHHQYKHNTKTGKVTIPKHKGEIDPIIVKSILNQAGLK
jgi:predicted RNA binding protein YcfA (HicA-like mRNA interferase family)